MNFFKKLCYLIMAGSTLTNAAGPDDFVMQVNTTLQGSPSTQFVIRTNAGLTYNYNVDCDVDNNNGYEATGVTGNYTCDYAALGLGAGTYVVGIEDNVGDLTGFPHANFNNNGDQRKIIKLLQWGKLKWSSMSGSFRGADHMDVTAVDVPDLSNVTNMSSMFRFAILANPDTTNWDVSGVTTMHSMFRSASAANPNTSNWVTTNLQTATNMFWNASLANPDMSGWDVSGVTDMSQMLLNANLSTTNYDAALSNFGSQALQNAVIFDVGTSLYCNQNAQAAKQAMTANDNWVINDGGLCAPSTAPSMTPNTDTGISNNDNITSETMPSFVIQCSAVSNVIKLYSDNPVANTLLASFTCISTRGTGGAASMTVTSPMSIGLHNVTYTDENGLDVSEQSPSTLVEIRAIPNQPAIIDLTDESDNGASFTDNVTSIRMPEFTAPCTAAGNNLQVYTDNPSVDTLIASVNCTAIQEVTFTSVMNLATGNHNISYTEQDVGGTSIHSPPLLVTIDLSLNDFVIQVKTDNQGSSSDTQFTIPTVAGEVYNYNVDCDNDGSNEATGLTGDYTCDYPSAGTYTIRIKDNTGMKIGYPRIKLANLVEARKVVSLDQWGTTIWTSMDQAFSNTLNMVVTATDVPDFSGLTSLRVMFSGAISANPDTSRWDTSNVTNINGIFELTFVANPDVSNWDTSQVTELNSSHKCNSFDLFMFIPVNSSKTS